jgi:two-component system, LuxR family, sensor kinase FixL
VQARPEEEAMQGVCEVESFNAMEEIRRLRDELAAAQYRIRQGEQLVCVAQNLREFSHEARNEVGILQNGLEVLPDLLEEPHEAAEFISLLKRQADRLHRLLDDVRETAAPLDLKREVCDVSETWRKAWASLVSHWKDRDVSFEVDVDDVSLWVPLDGFRMEQVFRNLFQNSLEASTDPLVVHVRCFQQPNESGYLTIAVGDNGPGLTPEQQRKLFSASFTTKPRGSGLGLSIAKRIIEAHGGDIRLGDGAFRGAEFAITLPIAQVPTLARSAT